MVRSGYGASRVRLFWAMRLQLVCTLGGRFVVFAMTSAVQRVV